MSEAGDKPAVAAALKRPAAPRAIAIGGLAVLAVLVALFLATRFGLVTPQGRLLIEAQTDGLQVGRIGEMHMEGLSGDIWRDFRVRRLTISDEKGVWLEAANIHIVWDYTALLRRNFDAELIEAERVRVLRRPTLRPKGKDRGLPVSFHIDALRGRLELMPAFSYRHGVYDLRGELNLERRGGRSGELHVASVLHPGDRLDAEFRFGGRQGLRLTADAVEARGGALAGALGLPATQPFSLTVRADGRMSEGRFTAVARSGETMPLYAQGAWTPEGGRAGGRLRLSASELTEPYAERFGREVVFGVAGRRVDQDFHAVAARVRSDALRVRLDGQANVGERRLGPRGLTVDAATADLSRIAGGGDLGAARVVGRLTGELASGRFSGSAVIADAGVGGYGLQRVSGPLQFAWGRTGLTVEGRLAGAGGRGDGYLAAILGGTPRVDFEAARLADGRLLLRDLEVAGRGLRLQASGGRSLLGALNFKGRAEISNLQAARPGASGGADVTWSAAQARAGRPWTVTLDARGERFASGFAQLDRLLGARPRLRGQANWQGGRLAVSRAVLDGEDLDVRLAGALRADRTLAFKADWEASGPLRAGPVEISGSAEGTGAVTGPLSRPRVDLIANVEEIDVPRLRLTDARVVLSFVRQPDGSSGAVAVNASSAYGPARLRSDFSFPQGGVNLTELDVNAGGLQASGSVALRRGAPSAANLVLAVERGAFLEAGRIAGEVRIVDGAGGARADIELRAQNARPAGSAITIRAGTLSAEGPMASLPYAVQARGLSGRGDWTVDGRGLLTEADPGYLVAFDGQASLGEVEVRTLQTATFRFGGELRSAQLRLASSEGGRLDLDAVLRGEAADVDARVEGMSLALLNEDLAGRVNATLSLQGQGERLTGVLDARLADARGRGSPAAQGLDGSLRGRLTDGALTLTASASNEQGLRSEGEVVLPVEASAQPFRLAVARQRPMRGRFFAEGEVAPLWDLLIGGERALAGHVRTQGTLGGTLADPNATGQIVVERGRFDDGGTGLTLRDVSLAAAFDDDTINVTSARGVDGRGGSVTGSGRISLLRNGVSSFRLTLDRFQLIDNEQAQASASGQATIARAADGKVKLTGKLVIDEAEVAAEPPTPSGVVVMDVVEINRPPELPATLPPASRRGSGWLLDVSLTAPRRVFLRGRGLDVELSLDAHVGGTTSRPDLSGTARVVRGDYEFAGKRFEFDTRSVVYLSTRPEDIRLQLDAVREDPTLSVTIRIRGTAARPEINLASSPSLPNDEILSQVLFGRSASQLSAVEAAQLASAISSLAGGGGLDVIGNLRAFAGLDRLAFGGDEAAGLTVAGGKYLSDDVYLELIGGGREGGAVQVEWRVQRNLAIISRLTGQGDNRLAIRWRRDY